MPEHLLVTWEKHDLGIPKDTLFILSMIKNKMNSLMTLKKICGQGDKRGIMR